MPRRGCRDTAVPAQVWRACRLVRRYGGPIALFGELFGVLAVIGWWLFFSRAPWPERLGAVALMVVALAATPRILDKSIATGMMGAMFAIYALPVLCVAFVAWAVATRRLSDGLRRASMVATILLASGVFALLRTDGVTGDGLAEFSWRWSETAEQRLVAQARDTPLAGREASPRLRARRAGDPPGSSCSRRLNRPLRPQPRCSGACHERAGIQASRMARLSRTRA